MLTTALAVALVILAARGLIALGDWLYGIYERGGPWRPWP